jgi:hypothetical protein
MADIGNGDFELYTEKAGFVIQGTTSNFAGAK